MKVNAITIGSILLLAAILMAPSAGEVPADDGSGVIHNPKGGKWGKKPLLALEHVRTIGDLDAVDGNYAFYLPSCVALDSAGDILILDSGNHRVQKFGPDGRYLASFGRKGQGPGEMFFPAWLDMDKAGNMYVTDPHNDRVQVLSPEGKGIRTVRVPGDGPGPAFVSGKDAGLLIMGHPAFGIALSLSREERKPMPPAIRVIDGEGRTVRAYGAGLDLDDELLNNQLNKSIVAAGPDGSAVVVFKSRNLIEKYSASGGLLWRADRELGFSMEVRDKGEVQKVGGGGVSLRMPDVNTASAAAAVDDLGRIWVVTFARQLRKEEKVETAISIRGSIGGGSTVNYYVNGDTDLRTTDAYKLELFDTDGTLLGELPLDVFVDALYVRGDRLFIVDKLRGARVLEYRIRNI